MAAPQLQPWDFGQPEPEQPHSLLPLDEHVFQILEIWDRCEAALRDPGGR